MDVAAVLKPAPQGDALARSVEQPRYERHVWRNVFGEVVIEVRGDSVFVDGELVEPVSASGLTYLLKDLAEE